MERTYERLDSEVKVGISNNVWFEEVNTGLIEEIHNTVRIRDRVGSLIPLDRKAIVIRKPEEDFKIEMFPCVSIYMVSYKHDPKRYNPEPIKIGKDEVKKVVVLEEPAVSFNLTCQIDFWSEYETDMDTMTMTWLNNHFRQFNLKVVDDGGVERYCNCLMQGSVVKSDLLSGGKRLFHSVVKLLIWVELDGKNRYNKPMVTHRDIDTQKE